MSKLVNPSVSGINMDLPLNLGSCKRPEVYNHTIAFKCPDCDYVLELDLSSGDELEYGSFYAPDCCDCCGVEFAPIDFEVTATIKITVKEGM